MGGYRPEIVNKTLDILMKRQLSLTDFLQGLIRVLALARNQTLNAF